jgi:hypothetical protein
VWGGYGRTREGLIGMVARGSPRLNNEGHSSESH